MNFTVDFLNFEQYTNLVEEYTMRQMSYQTDILDAFTGVLNSLRNSFRGAFVFGLPITELDAALIWEPDGRLERRTHPENGEPIFPSWSWAGWIGKVTWFVKSHLPLASRVTWVDTQGVRFASAELRGEEYAEMDSKSMESGTYFFKPDDPCRLYRYPIAPESHRPTICLITPGSEYLRFEARSAIFQVTLDEDMDEMFGGVFNEDATLTLRDESGFRAGIIGVSSSVGLEVPAFYEFVALSRTATMSSSDRSTWSIIPDTDEDCGKRPDPGLNEYDQAEDDVDAMSAGFDTRKYSLEKPWPIYNVLMIQPGRTFSRRVGLGVCHVDAFNAAKTELKRVVLG
ncbi:hypothetical protein BDY21DRAFT_344350 [Lineolata rhizophorae]|uniref:Uncharacterized protein n=1 Tax=Lineolata rhizophorae TaxID=578093 RepID=A0A6A6P149_9PEZI|nr:hypothetical protein BDY21DRAFT_344350 [Lineolata rhizophorae]